VRFPLKPDASEGPLGSNPAFWAFSGKLSTRFDTDVVAPAPTPATATATATVAADVTMPYSAHVVFYHEIDSRGPASMKMGDEGHMFALPNGDCIEVGIMQNPTTRLPELYREYWTAPPSPLGDGHRTFQGRPCLVAKTLTGLSSKAITNADAQYRQSRNQGVIIRVGDHCQGLLQVVRPDGQSELLVERWLKVLEDEKSSQLHEDSVAAATVRQGSGADWLKDWRSNTPLDEQVDALLPCMWVCNKQRKLNDEITARGVTWKIVEVA
jgi:hypothetical protein